MALVALFFVAVSARSSAQDTQGADVATRAKLDVGAAFLKTGDLEPAKKVFSGVLDADPTNWQTRALLLLSYLGSKDVKKAQIELQRLKTSKAPADTVAALERQIGSTQRSAKLRDDVVAF